MSNFVYVALVLMVVFVAALVLLEKHYGHAAAKSEFKQKLLLTPNEYEFFERLERAVPELRFFPQVAMGALLDPAVSRSNNKEFYRVRAMFSQKIVDFVAQRRSDGSIVAIIELDDRTHDPIKDAVRDAMLTGAGYRVVRWTSKAKPDAAVIRKTLLSTAK